MKTAMCPHCLKEFELVPNELLNRVCVVCSKGFKTSRKNSKYCSTRCYRRRPQLKLSIKARYRRRRLNPEWVKKQNKRAAMYTAKRYREDPVYRAKLNCRARVRSMLKDHGLSHSELIGCTNRHLKKHLESQFYGEMTWENYGKYWVIDHKIPLGKYDLSKPEHVKLACHYKNLQPLTRKDNENKSDSLTWSKPRFIEERKDLVLEVT